MVYRTMHNNHLMKHRIKLLLSLLSFSALVLLLLLLTLTTISPLHSVTNYHLKTPHTTLHLQIAQSTCQGTLHPHLCISTLSSFPDLRSKSLPEIISAAVNFTVGEVRSSASNCTVIRKKLPKLRKRDRQALDDCLELFEDTVSQLKTSISNLSPSNISSSKKHYQLQTLLSGAMTNQYTCLDGFAYSKSKVRKFIQENLFDISHHVSNSLAMLKKIKANSKKGEEVYPEYGEVKGGFPTWLSGKERRLLQAAVNETKYDLVVAKDGSGNFTTIGEAVAAAPNSSTTRFVIHIKAGAYYEYVEVERRKTMLMFVGDGIGKTLVKGNRNVVDGSTTFRSATVGKGFCLHQY